MYYKSIACLALFATFANAQNRGLRGLSGFEIEAGLGTVIVNQATGQGIATGLGVDTNNDLGGLGFGGQVNLCNGNEQYVTFAIAAGPEGTISEAQNGPGAAYFVSPCESLAIDEGSVEPIVIFDRFEIEGPQDIFSSPAGEDGEGLSLGEGSTTAATTFSKSASNFASFGVGTDGFSGDFGQTSSTLGTASSLTKSLRKGPQGVILTFDKLYADALESRTQSVSTGADFEGFETSGFLDARQDFAGGGSLIEQVGAFGRKLNSIIPEVEAGLGITVGDPENSQRVSAGLGFDLDPNGGDGISGGAGIELCQEGQILVFQFGIGGANTERPLGPGSDDTQYQVPCAGVNIDNSGVFLLETFKDTADDVEFNDLSIGDLNTIYSGEQITKKGDIKIVQSQGIKIGSPDSQVPLLVATEADAYQFQSLDGSTSTSANFLADINKDRKKLEAGSASRSFALSADLSQNGRVAGGVFDPFVQVSGGNSNNANIEQSLSFASTTTDIPVPEQRKKKRKWGY